MAVELNNPEKRMLGVMQSNENEDWTVQKLCNLTKFEDQAIIVGAGIGLVEKGLAIGIENKKTFWILGNEGIKANSEGLLEIKLWEWLQSSSDTSMKSLQTSSVVEKHEIGIGIGLLKSLGVTLESGNLIIPENKVLINEKLNDRRLFLEKIGFSEKGILEEELDNDLLNHFRNRKSLLISLEEVSRTWKITNEGMKISSEDLE